MAVSRKARKVVGKKIKAVRSVKREKSARAITKIAASEIKKEAFADEKLVIEKEKFSHPEITRMPRMMPQELPGQYGQNVIVLQVRDPWWLYVYWEVTGSTYERLRSELKEDFYRARRVLRVYDVSNITFNGKNANRYFDVEINEHASSWYIDTGGAGRSWCVDLGLLLPSGKFITILRSNIVTTPLDGPSWITDEEWMIPEDMFARLYGMGFGLGRSSPGKAWQERAKRALFSGALASPGLASMASPVKKPVQEDKFWMVVNCELIVYGATEPDAKVTVQGVPINLRKDGTFSLRFALPDGKQVISVKGKSARINEERVITPIVNRETK